MVNEVSNQVNVHTTNEHEKTRAELKEQGSQLAALQGQGNETAATVAGTAATVAGTAADVAALKQEFVASFGALEESVKYMMPLIEESAKKLSQPYRPLEQSDIDNIDTTTVPEAITLDSFLKSCESVASPLATRSDQEEQIARLRKENEELLNLNKKRSPEKDENPRPTKKKWFPSFGKK